MTLELPDFLIIPSKIINDKNLRQTDGNVYGIIYWTTKLQLKKCILSNEAMATMLRVSNSSISHSISRLADNGYIEVIFRDGNKHQQREEIIPKITFGSSNENVDNFNKNNKKRLSSIAQTY